MKYLTLVLLVACATPVEDYEPLGRDWVMQELEQWTQYKNPAGTCAAHAHEVRLNVVETQDELQALCQNSVPLHACLNGDVIHLGAHVVGTSAYERVITHELRHWLGRCSFGIVDHQHESPSFWYPDRSGNDIRSDK